MKNNFLTPLLGILLVGSLAANIYFFRQRDAESKKDLSIAHKLLQSNQDEISFVKFFLQSYFSHEDQNWMRTQISLLTLMEPSLQERRKKELNELSEQTAEHQDQILKIESVQALENSNYVSFARIEFMEKASDKSSSAQPRVMNLLFRIELSLKKSPVTLENPWGYSITKIDSIAAEQTPLSSFITAIPMNRSVELAFTCVGTPKFETPAGVKSSLLFKQIYHLTLQSDQEIAFPLKIDCQDSQLKLNVTAAQVPALKYLEIPAEYFKKIVKAPVKKDQYDETIEKAFKK